MKFCRPYKLQKKYKQRKHLIRQVSLGTLVILLTTITLSFLFIYHYASSILIEQSTKLAHYQVDNAEDKLSGIFDDIYNNINLLVYNDDVYTIAKDKKTAMDFSYHTRIKSLTSLIYNMVYENEYIHSIYIYINDNVYFSNSDYASIPDTFGDIPILQSEYYQKLCSSVYKTALTTEFKYSDFSSYTKNITKDDTPLITLGCASNNRNTKSVIIININALNLGELFDTCFENNSIAYLSDDNGQHLICTDASNHSDIPSQTALSDNRSEIGESSGNPNDNKGQFIYQKLKNCELTIVKYIPYAEIHKDSFYIGICFLIVFITFSTTTFLLMRFWISRSLKPINILCQKMEEIELGNLGIQINHDYNNELDLLIQHFNHMSNSLAKTEIKNKQMSDSLRILELQSLRTQLNPHFIFNTLNMLKWMAIKYHVDELEECIIALAEILYPIFREDSEMTTLKKEFFYLEKYITILHYRFNNKITLNISLDSPLENMLIPRLIIQPLIENCVHHGHYNDGSTLTIHITTQIKNGILEISVADNGQGMDENRLKQLHDALANSNTLGPDAGKHVGLANVHQRIQLHYGPQYGLNIRSEQGKGTTVTMLLPSNNN